MPPARRVNVDLADPQCHPPDPIDEADMHEIDPELRNLLDRIVSGRLAWASAPALAEALGWDVERTSDGLALLDLAGLVEVWERDEGPVVTLSALAAGRLGVKLIELGREAALCWRPISEPDPAPPKAKCVIRAVRAADLAHVVDPGPGPDLAAENAERIEAADKKGIDPRLGPRPTLLLGETLTPWPGPRTDVAASCPACGSKRLRPHVYCLCCDRWGFDPPPGSTSKRRRTGTSNRGELRQRAARERRKGRRVARWTSSSR